MPAALVCAILSAAVHCANPIIDAASYTTLAAKIKNGVLYHVSAPGSAPLDVLHVFGSPYERGEAHGRLISAKILDFVETSLPAFFRSYVGELEADLDKLPKWLQDLIIPLLHAAEKEAPKAFDLALSWVESVQREYNNASSSGLYDEMDGIAHGACAAAAEAGRACDASALVRTIRQVNMLPDLIRMQCSMAGAWGGATPRGSLVQLRSLDFGGGPFANATMLIVHHPNTSGSESQAAQPFASLSFPAFVGVVTGFSPSVALSEKVNMVTGGHNPPGSYHGRSTSFVIRDMVALAQTKEEAHAIAEAAQRTWGVWLGVGDFASQRMIIVRYTRADALAFNETTMPTLTAQPPIDDVVYVDKHPQPSTQDLAMPTALQALREHHGIDATAMARLGDDTQSGDVHIAVYDYTPSAPQVPRRSNRARPEPNSNPNLSCVPN